LLVSDYSCPRLGATFMNPIFITAEREVQVGRPARGPGQRASRSRALVSTCARLGAVTKSSKEKINVDGSRPRVGSRVLRCATMPVQRAGLARSNAARSC
jgi:hypothetical protein